MKLKVVHRDGQLLAVHKPAGMATYQESSSKPDSPIAEMGCKEQLEEQLTQRLFPVHRIDADTEGLVLFALDSKTAAALIRLFKEQQVQKTYLAWCTGTLPSQGKIQTPLRKPKSDHRESALTEFERLKVKNGYSLVRVFPATGRFHQIRRHFDSIGNALVGDPKYGKREAWSSFFTNPESARLMLLAESVEFLHPQSKRPVRIRIKASKEFGG
jgi:tRNA pseudouridine65 synthase